MSVTLFSHKNKLDWVGVRPAVYGEQVIVSGSAINQISLLYTVPAGKTLLLFNNWHKRYSSAVGAQNGSLSIWTAVPALVYTLSQDTQNIAGAVNVISTARSIPIEIPEGYLIRLIETTAAGSSWAGIEGILINPLENS
jgi:hypothetical protein